MNAIRASWQKQVSRVKALSAADVRDRVPSDSSLTCPIDNKLFRDAVKTPCCGTLYCEECIQTHLLERDFICPNCAKKIASLDKLIVDKPARIKVVDYIEKAIEDSKKEGEEELTPRDGTSGVANQVHTMSLYLKLAFNLLCRTNKRHRSSKIFIRTSSQISTWTCLRWSSTAFLSSKHKFRRSPSCYKTHRFPIKSGKLLRCSISSSKCNCNKPKPSQQHWQQLRHSSSSNNRCRMQEVPWVSGCRGFSKGHGLIISSPISNLQCKIRRTSGYPSTIDAEILSGNARQTFWRLVGNLTIRWADTGSKYRERDIILLYTLLHTSAYHVYSEIIKNHAFMNRTTNVNET